MAAVMGERNTEDSRRKSEAVKAGLARRRAEGNTSAVARYGLTWVRNAADEREVVPEPTEGVIVRRMVAEFLAGISQLRIAQNLYADRVPTARGGVWRQGTVRRVLSNPAIAGLIRDGEGFIEAEHDGIIDRNSGTRWRATSGPGENASPGSPEFGPAPLPQRLPPMRPMRSADGAAHREK